MGGVGERRTDAGKKTSGGWGGGTKCTCLDFFRIGESDLADGIDLVLLVPNLLLQIAQPRPKGPKGITSGAATARRRRGVYIGEVPMRVYMWRRRRRRGGGFGGLIIDT